MAKIACNESAKAGARVSIDPETIKVGQCYQCGGNLRRVLRIMPDGRIQYEQRSRGRIKAWKPGMLSVTLFAASVERQVPCDWTPEREQKRCKGPSL